jgi:hypothetical protein
MPNFYYTDATGQKRGLINNEQLKALVARGIITPDTLLETEAGQKGKAGQIKGLFPAAPTPVTQTALPKAPASVATKIKRLHLIIGLATALVCVIGLVTIGAFFSSPAKKVAGDVPIIFPVEQKADNPFEDPAVERKTDNPFAEDLTDNPFAN